MKCLDCSAKGRDTEAIGICHHCSAGICVAHRSLVSDPVGGASCGFQGVGFLRCVILASGATGATTIWMEAESCQETKRFKIRTLSKSERMRRTA